MHAEIDDVVALFRGTVQHHRPTAADAAHPRFEHAERERCRNRRIDRIAATRQHGRAGFGGAPVLRRDDAARAAHRGFAQRQARAEVIDCHAPRPYLQARTKLA